MVRVGTGKEEQEGRARAREGRTGGHGEGERTVRRRVRDAVNSFLTIFSGQPPAMRLPPQQAPPQRAPPPQQPRDPYFGKGVSIASYFSKVQIFVSNSSSSAADSSQGS